MLHVATQVSTNLEPCSDQIGDEVLADQSVSCAAGERILLQHMDLLCSTIFVFEHIICYASIFK